MKTIKQDELFQGLSDFLKGKGIELKDGLYPQHIRQACNLLGDTINATQRTARKAKDEVDKKLEQLRQTVHEATAPKPPPASSKATAASAARTRKPKSMRKRSTSPNKPQQRRRST